MDNMVPPADELVVEMRRTVGAAPTLYQGAVRRGRTRLYLTDLYETLKDALADARRWARREANRRIFGPH